MNIDNQSEYWDNVAALKTFTHPLDLPFLNSFLPKDSKILDYGCGYGRVVKALSDNRFENVLGFDTSEELIRRGKKDGDLNLFHIEYPKDLPIQDNSLDCIILFAVLTCIPSNKGQMELLKLLYSKLKTGGIIYISDYYLQKDSKEMKDYQYLDNDLNNFGVFSLPEGATFRHHTYEWIAELTKDFKILFEKPIDVMTMNGHKAKGFQIIGQR